MSKTKRTMNHEEIRFNILHLLYQKHYSDQLRQPQLTDNIIEEANLGGIDRNLVCGDIVYLADSGVVNGQYMLGRASPYAIRITNRGIDAVANIINQSIGNLERTDLDNQAKTEVKEISKENNSVVKVKRIVEYAKLHTKLWLNIMTIVKLVISYQLVGIRIQLKKPIWACTTCGMYSSRRYSVERHIKNIHGGGADLISYTDYIIDRKSGIYLPGIYPTYIPKNKDEGYSGPHYMDICKDELFRCTIRKYLK